MIRSTSRRTTRWSRINSALAVDLTGQVCADSIGTRLYSGVGGQLDFTRGAARSKGGMPIIAFLSTAKEDTLSRITPTLLEGSGVVTTRNDVHFVATEYGVASLHGKTIRQRAQALINIAHPKFREELTQSPARSDTCSPSSPPTDPARSGSKDTPRQKIGGVCSFTYVSGYSHSLCCSIYERLHEQLSGVGTIWRPAKAATD